MAPWHHWLSTEDFLQYNDPAAQEKWCRHAELLQPIVLFLQDQRSDLPWCCGLPCDWSSRPCWQWYRNRQSSWTLWRSCGWPCSVCSSSTWTCWWSCSQRTGSGARRLSVSPPRTYPVSWPTRLGSHTRRVHPALWRETSETTLPTGDARVSRHIRSNQIYK